MDIRYFLKARTAFIRSHYDVAAGAFEAIIRAIEDGRSPYAPPPGYEDEEPAFLEEWMNASTSVQLVGLACMSLLNDALKLYLTSMQRERLRFTFDELEQQRLKKEYVGTYKQALGEIFDTDWGESGADFAVIEQVVLARNRGQHGTSLTSFHMTHDKRTLSRHPRPHFADEREVRAWEQAGSETENVFLVPPIAVGRETLFSAIAEVERLGEWMEANLPCVERWRQSERQREGSE